MNSSNLGSSQQQKDFFKTESLKKGDYCRKSKFLIDYMNRVPFFRYGQRFYLYSNYKTTKRYPYNVKF